VGELQFAGQSIRALGYRNTDTNLPDFFTQRNWLLTMLHGPVLAKNPNLQQALVREILRFAELSYPTVLNQEAIDWFEKIATISQKIWQLEAADEAFEG
jgi:CobQ-like glutamine amidotransferase family enzyme